MRKLFAVLVVLLLALSVLPQSQRTVGGIKTQGGVTFGVPNTSGGGASLNKGFNFRASSGCVTDGANETYVIGVTSPADLYKTTRNGVDFGWETTAPDDVDRNCSGDRRLAGIHYAVNGAGTSRTLRVDMAPGTYTIHLAIGDASSSHSPQYVEIYDDTTLRSTIDSSSNSNEFLDATGVARTAANWPSQNVGLSVLVSSGILKIKIGKSSGGDVTSIAHLYID